MLTTISSEPIGYDQFREAWLSDLTSAELSSLDKGRRFAAKLITQWLDTTTDDEDFIVCDGTGDGGIDIAYLSRADTDSQKDSDNVEEGDTWYLVQSKYGSSYSGAETIRQEGQKVIDTLQGGNLNLSQDTRRLLEKIDLFRKVASDADRIVLVLATTDPISQQEREVLDDIKIIGRERIAPIFDVADISLRTIWEAIDHDDQARLSIDLRGQFVEQTPGLLVGTISLMDLFAFLRSYRQKTGDLNQLYAKNVRQFLGGRRKVNKGIAQTLNQNPEKFGLYNNGITIVVAEYDHPEDNSPTTVIDPYIVNGCQTTKTIWEVLEPKINHGGTGEDPTLAAWEAKVKRGGVVAKVVRSDEAEITNITRFTNSQNSVREQDFIALDSGFQSWARTMAEDHKVFLEIQRGGMEARKAWEKAHPDQPRFEAYANAFELIKVYGAGWMSEPGLAFGKNAPFLPSGSVYERIISRQDDSPAFGAPDLYAAYQIKILADGIGFGRQADQPSRRQSRFLFYHIFMSMLRNVILLTPQLEMTPVLESDLTEAVLKLTGPEYTSALERLGEGAVGLVDQYLTAGTSPNSAFSEESFTAIHNGDLNAFLKADNLGKEKHSPKLEQALAITNEAFGMSGGRRQVAEALVEAFEMALEQ